MLQLAQVFNPIVPNVEVDKFGLTLQVLYLPDEVVAQVKFAKFGVLNESHNLFYLIKGQNESEQIWHALEALNLLDLVIEKVEIDDALDLVLTAYALDDVDGDVVELAAHWYFGRHGVLNRCGP